MSLLKGSNSIIDILCKKKDIDLILKNDMSEVNKRYYITMIPLNLDKIDLRVIGRGKEDESSNIFIENFMEQNSFKMKAKIVKIDLF